MKEGSNPGHANLACFEQRMDLSAHKKQHKSINHSAGNYMERRKAYLEQRPWDPCKST